MITNVHIEFEKRENYMVGDARIPRREGFGYSWKTMITLSYLV